MKTHKDLEVWKEAVKLSVICYDMTKGFPREEQFGLVSQMRRAAISIASNIAEGAARAGNKEFIQFLYISLGSASELDTQIEIA
ncbi:four helix bundle protein, partial [Dehalococcoidia bacterium]|nr:four helix bundle protein [Dehalococcoidia bacterium]